MEIRDDVPADAMSNGPLSPLAARLRARGGLARIGRGHALTAGAISMVLRAVLLVGKFAFMVVLAGYTSPSTLGVYALLVTIVTIAIYIIGLEIHTFTAREIVSEDAAGRGAIHIQSHFITVAMIFLVAVPVVWWFTGWLGIAGKFSFALLTAIILCESFGQELGRYLMVLSRPVASNILQFLRGAAWMPAPILLLMLGGRAHAMDIILWAWLVGTIAACLFGFWHIRQYFRTRGRYRMAWLTEAFLSARHYLVVALLTQVQYYSDRFIIQRSLGEGVVGVYSFYQSFANTMVAFVQTGVVSVLLPQLLLAAKRDDVVAERKTRATMMAWAMALAVGISVTLGAGMPVLLGQLHKDAYAGSLSDFYILLVGNVILVAGLVVHLALYARRRDVDLMRVSLAFVPLGLVINIVVVPIFGITGAACTFALTALLEFVVKSRILMRTGSDASRSKEKCS